MTESIEREHLGMVSCDKCKASNSLDSRFCKKCGEALPEAELEEASTKLDELVAEGYKVLAEGHPAEAMMIANSALTTNPTHPRALGLKGMCHEREGEVAEALECFERVLAANPDSALDRIKVNQLRNRLAAGLVVEPEPPNRKLALTAAAATVLLVMAGAAFLSVFNRPDDRAAALQGSSGAQLEALKVNTPSAESPASDQSATATNQTQQPGVGATGAAPGPLVNPTGGVLPVPQGNGSTIEVGTEPVRPPIIGDIGLRPDPNAQQTTQSQEPVRLPPVDMRKDPDPIEEREPEPAKENNGIVDIRISKDSARTVGGSENLGGNSLEALVQTARNQYLLGRYGDAARTFERALKAGGEPGSINQRLGQCYEKLGQSPQAIAAYERAIAAYEAAAKSGAGGDRVKTALEASRQALKVLQAGG